MKKQFTLGLAALVFASSSAFAVEPIRKGPGVGATHELERLRKAGVVEKSGVAGKSHTATIEIARVTAVKTKLKLEGNGLETLITENRDITYQAKLEGPDGNQNGTRPETVNTKKLVEETIALYESIEAGTFNATSIQVAGVKALLKFLSFGGMTNMIDRPGEAEGTAASQTRDAIKFVKVMKDTIEMKKSDTTEENIQGYVTIAESATKDLEPGRVIGIRNVYNKIGEEPKERNSNCLE